MKGRLAGANHPQPIAHFARQFLGNNGGIQAAHKTAKITIRTSQLYNIT